VSELGGPVLQLLAPVSGERILDVGCGDGDLTRKIAEAGCSVVGLDSSPDFCAAERARGLEVVELSAQALGFRGEFEILEISLLSTPLGDPVLALGLAPNRASASGKVAGVAAASPGQRQLELSGSCRR